jgi:transcriptional regulator with XRE-family HTH domain
MNDLIVRKIREARKERGMTQENLAAHLGKTSAAISDLERGKVRVSASDLHLIAEFFNKPIEYFYGEQIGEKEIQDIVSVLRKQTPEGRDNSIAVTNMILQMQQLGDRVKAIPEDDEVPIDLITDFYKIFVPFSISINEMSKQLKDLREMFDAELKKRGIDISGN